MRFLVASAAALIAVASVAEEVKSLSKADLELLHKDYSSLSPSDKAKRDELAKLRFLIQEGGEMVRPGTPSGRILVVNRQKRLPADALKDVKSLIQTSIEYDVQFSDRDEPAAVVLCVIDDPKARSLAVYPEEGRVEVNVAALAADNPKPVFLRARVRKELMRGFACVTAGSTYGTRLYSRVSSPKELDDIPDEGLPMDVMLRTSRFLGAQGVKPLEISTYRAVIGKGYDIAPTNAYQKAIYEKTKAKMSFEDRRKKHERK